MDPHDQQGALVAGCAHCKVLYPDVATCPRCDGIPRMRPAQMLDEHGVAALVVAAVDDYDGSPERLGALLDVLLVYRPRSIEALDADGRVDLDRLRRDDRRQHPSES